MIEKHLLVANGSSHLSRVQNAGLNLLHVISPRFAHRATVKNKALIVQGGLDFRLHRLQHLLRLSCQASQHAIQLARSLHRKEFLLDSSDECLLRPEVLHTLFAVESETQFAIRPAATADVTAHKPLVPQSVNLLRR